MDNNNLEDKTFSIIKQIPEYEVKYLEILNTLKQFRKDNKMPLGYVARALKKSKATISNFENNINFDYELLFKYAALFDFRVFLDIQKLTHSDILRK